MSSMLPAISSTQNPSGDDASVACWGAPPTVAWKNAFEAGFDALTKKAAQTSGEFAVAVEAPDGSRAFGAVDRFAVRPLCYSVVHGRLHFSERADALAPFSTGLDAQAIFDYLYFHNIPSPRTIFGGVRRVPAAHYVALRDGVLETGPYWTPRFQADRTPAESFTALQAEFRKILKDAVASQLDGSKAACFLSGGTDSSTVAGMIREVTGTAAHCYSIGFDAEGYDEMAYARLAARHFGCQHHEYYVTADDLVRGIPAVAASLDQPFGNSSVLPAYYCALQACEDGVTRLLAGDGGDELYGGNSRYAKQRVFDWYDRVPAVVRRDLLEPFFLLSVVGRTPLLKKGSSYIEQARVPMPDRLQMYNLLLRLGVAEVLTPDFLAQVHTDEPTRHQREVWALAEGGGDLNRSLAYDWRYTLGESDLPKVRSATQLAGVSVGYPMLDQALLDFSMRLPESYKLKGLKLRWFFKEALRGFLPDEILAKKKKGFGLPFGVWATRHAGLKALAADSLGSLTSRGLVRSDFVKRLLDAHLPAHPGYYGEMVWILMMLEQWLRAHAPDWRVPA